MLKKVATAACFALGIAAVCVGFSYFARNDSNFSVSSENKFYAAQDTAQNDEKITLSLSIGSQILNVNGEEKTIDAQGTVPIVENGRTLLPVRAIIEAVGGSIEWNAEEKASTVTYLGDEVKLVINSLSAYKNGEKKELDAAPVIVNGRTMLPIRFIAESFGFDVDWNSETKTVTIVAAALSSVASNTNAPAVTEPLPIVYMTTDISPKGLQKVYEALNFKSEGKVAVKMSTGEPPNSNYLRPELIGDFIKSVDGTIVECNTAYGGSRAETAAHKQVAKEHGFYEIADVDIMDEDGSMAIPVPVGTRISEDFVGAHLANYDTLISLAHFKGHAMGGFGGAIKNLSIGVASSEGKVWIHTGGTSKTGSIFGEQIPFLESMAEAASSVSKYFDGHIVYINVMNRLSVDCDCDGNPHEPDMHDVGILASYDPVALDQACVDLVYKQKDGDGASLVERIESRQGIHTLEHAEEIGYGSRNYKIESID